MTGCPDKRLMLGAMVDGELDAGHALELEAHLETCRACQEELAMLRSVKAALAAHELAHTPPPGFHERMLAALDAEDLAAAPPRRRGAGPFAAWFSGGAVTAIAASLALFTLVAPPAPSLTQELVQDHVRSLQAQHLLDVPTSDRHTVKPWFNGKIDFAPPVADLATVGFPLAGGRLDEAGGRTVAALVYRRRAHVINLFVWPGSAPAAASVQRREGYCLIRWSHGGLIYWAVSDIDPADLEAFRKAFVAATAT